jgi:NitT/TauT family transport system substrate-binding protein
MSNSRILLGKRRLWTATGLLLLGVVLCAGCSGKNTSGGASRSSGGSGPDKVVLMLNWYPEAEHGGFYAAKVHGIFEKYGLDVQIRPGGPNAPVAQELVTGRAQFAVGNANDVLLFRQADAPVVAVLAAIQNTPRCVLVRADSGVDSLYGLKGMTLQANRGRPFLDFMESKGLLNGVQVVPYSGTVANLVADPKTAIQAYSFSEPFLARQQGVEVKALMVSDIGYNPYVSCMITTESMIKKDYDLVARMVVASREGWKKYFESPAETNAKILAENEHGMTLEALNFGVAELLPLSIPDGMSADDIGVMSAERWETLAQQFVDLKLIDPRKVVANQAYRLDFLERTAPTQ